MKKNFVGIGASKGIVIAKAYKLEEINLDIENKVVENIEEEIIVFKNAIDNTIKQLDEIKEVATVKLGAEEAEVFEAHKTIVLDPELITQVESQINDGTSAGFAVKTVTDMFVSMFESMEDKYFQERSADIKDVRKRLIANVLGLEIPNLSTIKEEVVIIANDLTPSETSQLNKEYTKGFITNIGGRTSHAAIMARSMEIPAIVGTGDILENVENGAMILLNAVDGTVVVDPSEDEITAAKVEIKKLEELKILMEEYKNKKTVSKDGYHTEIAANIGTPNDLEGVIKNGAEGIGLYRTEFLYMDSSELPSEEVQYEAYKKVIEDMEGKPVVVRTLDIGGDKELPYLSFPEEMNPFLGYRAIRMCLDRVDIFKVQIRALLRASAFGNLKIMFPMIATLEEYRNAKKVIEDEKANLKVEGIAFSNDIEVGIMVEIPSTAMMADTFAKEVDFFSIGTNDLIQYTMAADRMSEKVSYLYQPYNPAILRMVKNVIDASNKHNIWTGMCGEMASDPIAIILLLGMGLHEFSMSASAVLEARMQIANLDKGEIEKHLNTILDLTTANEVEQYVKENLMK